MKKKDQIKTGFLLKRNYMTTSALEVMIGAELMVGYEVSEWAFKGKICWLETVQKPATYMCVYVYLIVFVFSLNTIVVYVCVSWCPRTLVVKKIEIDKISTRLYLNTVISMKVILQHGCSLMTKTSKMIKE